MKYRSSCKCLLRRSKCKCLPTCKCKRKTSLRPLRKRKRRSSRRSKRKSGRRSKRKSGRRFKRKSGRRSLRKSGRRSKRKSGRRSLRKQYGGQSKVVPFVKELLTTTKNLKKAINCCIGDLSKLANYYTSNKKEDSLKLQFTKLILNLWSNFYTEFLSYYKSLDIDSLSVDSTTTTTTTNYYDLTTQLFTFINIVFKLYIKFLTHIKNQLFVPRYTNIKRITINRDTDAPIFSDTACTGKKICKSKRTKNIEIVPSKTDTGWCPDTSVCFYTISGNLLKYPLFARDLSKYFDDSSKKSKINAINAKLKNQAGSLNSLMKGIEQKMKITETRKTNKCLLKQ